MSLISVSTLMQSNKSIPTLIDLQLRCFFVSFPLKWTEINALTIVAGCVFLLRGISFKKNYKKTTRNERNAKSLNKWERKNVVCAIYLAIRSVSIKLTRTWSWDRLPARTGVACRRPAGVCRREPLPGGRAIGGGESCLSAVAPSIRGREIDGGSTTGVGVALWCQAPEPLWEILRCEEIYIFGNEIYVIWSDDIDIMLFL